jgi:hypothetical protein
MARSKGLAEQVARAAKAGSELSRPAATSSPNTQASRIGKKQITCHLDPETNTELKILSAKLGLSVEAIVANAIADVLRNAAGSR